VKFIETEVPGVVVIEPVVHKDDRGFFLETFHRDKFAEAGLDVAFVQDNHSKSTRGTLRGLHSQWRRPQGKLVRVLDGEIWDVAVDVRKGSPTFGRWVGVTLSSENFKQLYVPPGYLHGFVVISATAEVEYKCTDVYDPGHELGVLWNDPEIGIRWPIDDVLLSAKDAEAPNLSAVSDKLPVYEGP
jgi:dTDP-4-dehydrorhamnose 3,5-epimerase